MTRCGYKILERNLKLRFGEIDLIAAKDDLIVFCEVKSRRSAQTIQPFEAVGPEKQHRLKALAEGYISRSPITATNYRFDVICVYFDGREQAVDHIENAFF